ncbi:hypothetical protein, partial [Bartonella florencae]|uniref:hypothetical protein n=1 Tax=Bartonella florencae TaxID=928210 RepID=UPI000559730D
GPQITTEGINVSGKKITHVANGTEGTDAVNKAQLDEDVIDLSNKVEEVRSVAVLYDEEDPKGDNLLTRSARKVNKNSVTFGNPETGTVSLHNVGNGVIASESHDAVNGSQLFETND